MSDAVHYERVREHLELLRLDAALADLDGMLETAAREERSPAWLLDQLLTSERTHRFERRVAANLKLSGIPNRKSLDDFDFDAQPGVSQRTVADLATLRFLRAGENVLILGPTGVGKTHCKSAGTPASTPVWLSGLPLEVGHDSKTHWPSPVPSGKRTRGALAQDTSAPLPRARPGAPRVA